MKLIDELKMENTIIEEFKKIIDVLKNDPQLMIKLVVAYPEDDYTIIPYTEKEESILIETAKEFLEDRLELANENYKKLLKKLVEEEENNN